MQTFFKHVFAGIGIPIVVEVGTEMDQLTFVFSR